MCDLELGVKSLTFGFKVKLSGIPHRSPFGRTADIPDYPRDASNFVLEILLIALNKKTHLIVSFFCGAKRDRTAGLLNAIQALSQLSYSPVILVQK